MLNYQKVQKEDAQRNIINIILEDWQVDKHP